MMKRGHSFSHHVRIDLCTDKNDCHASSKGRTLAFGADGPGLEHRPGLTRYIQCSVE